MIRARLKRPAGPDVVMLGLSRENVKRLKAGRPVYVRGDSIGAGHDICIVYGDSEAAIAAEMREHGLEVPQFADPKPGEERRIRHDRSSAAGGSGDVDDLRPDLSDVLAYRERQVLTLRRQGLSYDEIAERLKVTPGRIRAVERGALAQLEQTRWLTQTKATGGHAAPEERGDCVPACIASILGLPITAIGNTHGEGWWDRLQAEVAKHGYCLALLDMKLEPPPTFWIAAVPSLNLPPDPDGKTAWHSVVARGHEMVHDPAIGERYDEGRWAEVLNGGEVAEGWVLAPLDPLWEHKP